MVGNNKEQENIDALIIAYKGCTDEKKKRVLHLKITSLGLNLVKKFALNVAKPSNSSVDDLIQVGAVGLIKAIDFFIPNKNAKFLTYATHFIKGEIRHYVRDKSSIIKTPRRVHELLVKIQIAMKDLQSEGITEPSISQIAEYLNLKEDMILEIMKADKFKSTVSLDQNVYSESEEDTLMDKIPSGDYQEFLSSYEDKMMLDEAIKKLPKELRDILELSFYEELNQREIAEKLNISQMQVSRRLKKALNKMYDIIKRN